MITEKNVNHVARLSRIHLQPEEITHLTTDLENILKYIDKLNTLDVTGIEPTSHVLPLKNVYRKDEIKPSLSQKEALKISVEQHNGSFKVPRIIE